VEKTSIKEEEFLKHIRENEGILHKISFVYARSEDDKEDLYQEMVLQLWKSYPSYRGDAVFSTWMYRVALNTALGMKRKFRFFSLPEGEYPGVSVDMEPGFEHSENLRLLYRAVSRLKELEKALILLWLDEKSYREISDTLGISEKNVSVMLVRVKTKLADIIKKMQ